MNRTSAKQFPVSWHDIALPLVLVLTGLVLVSGDWLGLLSLDRIADYWPCGVILVGLANMTRVEPMESGSESIKHARL